MRAISRALQVSRANLAKKKQGRPEAYKKKDEKLLKQIKEILAERPTYGYRRVGAMINHPLKSQGDPLVNHKRIYRVMRENGLLLKKPKVKEKRPHTGKVATITSNIRWCSDSFVIQCQNGEQVHVAFSIDACDREVMRYIASTIGIDGQAIRDLMLESIEYRMGQSRLTQPIQWLTDNGSCYTARETVRFGKELGLEIRTTPAYSPESNGLSEAFVKTFKRDYVWPGDISNAKVVMEKLKSWFEDYNERAPHKALKMLSPREYIEKTKLAG
jgi:putative transposase